MPAALRLSCLAATLGMMLAALPSGTAQAMCGGNVFMTCPQATKASLVKGRRAGRKPAGPGRAKPAAAAR